MDRVAAGCRDWPYWSIDVPGLTAEQAEWLSSVVNDSQRGLTATAVNPRIFLTLHLDRESVASLRSALLNVGSSDSIDGLQETLEEWLSVENVAGQE